MKIIKKIFLILLSVVTFSNASDSLWTVISKMPTPVSGGVAVTFEDKIYILGGYSDSLYEPIKLIQVFDPNTLEWKVDSKMLESRAFLYAASNDSGIYYGGGGIDSTFINIENYRKLELYTPSELVVSLPKIYDDKIIFNRNYSSAEMKNNYLFLIGGYGIGSYNLIVKYDVASKSIVETFEAQNISSIGMMTALLNDKLYLIGGYRNSISKNISSIDLKFKNPISEYATLLEPRADGKAVAIDASNQIYVMGGINELEYSLESVEIITTSNHDVSITAGPKLNHGRTNFMATEYNNRIYVFGGLDKNYFTINSVEVLEVKPNSVYLTSPDIPTEFSLKQNYPNPFNPSTKIEYSIPSIVNSKYLSESNVILKVYDILGREIAILVNEVQTAGTYSVSFIASNYGLSSGVYYYSLSVSGYSLTNKMILTK